MSKDRGGFEIEQKALGQLLAENRLVVPVNQRSYAWQEDHVAALLQDFDEAVSSDEREYFLGTILLTRPKDRIPEIADGQQRLATVTILLAAIRDYLFKSEHLARANAITHTYLFITDLRTEESLPRLKLNVDDSDFFRCYVLCNPDSPQRDALPNENKPSNERIKRAAEMCGEYVDKMAKLHKDNIVSRLIDWVEFIKNGAKVILVTVPDYINAFTAFETMNDRGRPIAQSDILKNYLFDKAGDQVQSPWQEMVGAIETVGDDELLVTYIRHLWITKHGPTREHELLKEIKKSITSKQRAVDFVHSLKDSASDYSALLNPSHKRWADYGMSTKGHIATITKHLRVEQIRPLMLAVVRNFSAAEARKAFRLFVSWSVRFLICGGRGGLLDRNYAIRAKEVGTGEIATAAALAEAMHDIIPPDATFGTVFSVSTISKAFLARYYLRAIELQAKADPEPELIPNEDEETINLEHVLPENPSKSWKIEPEMARVFYRRIGNMVLLQATKNVDIGNEVFEKKKPHYKKSAFITTSEVAKYRQWGIDEINDRQYRLAKLAVKTWPIEVR